MSNSADNDRTLDDSVSIGMFEVDQPDGSKLFELRVPGARGSIQLMLVSPIVLSCSDISSVAEVAKRFAIDVAAMVYREAFGVEVQVESGPRVPLPKPCERN